MKKIVLILLVALILVPSISFWSGLYKDMNEEGVEDTDINDSSLSQSNSTNKKEIDFSNLSYVAFGDSITYGRDWTYGSVNYAQQMEYPYPKLVGSELGLKSVDNQGVGSSTLCVNPNGSCSITNIILSYSSDVDIISVTGGVNDYANLSKLGTINDMTTDTIYGSLNLIAEYLTSTYDDAFVFFITPYNTTYKSDALFTMDHVSNAFIEVGAKWGIPVLDLYNYGQFELEMYSHNSDGVHPSQAFFKEYTAPQIAQFIRENYK